MANEYKNKVIFGGNVLMDLTADTVDTSHLLSGITAHNKSGAPITGTCTYDADTSDATAIASEILSSVTAYVNGVKLTGTMPNVGAEFGQIDSINESISINQGYHDGAGSIGISTTEKAKIIPSNIKSGITILGVTGSYSGESISATTAEATPSTSVQTILPPSGYDYLSQVSVKAIPYTEVVNAAGGITVTIG